MNIKRKRVDYQDFHLVSNGKEITDIDIILLSIYSLSKLKPKESLIFKELCYYCLKKGDIYFPCWLLDNSRSLIKINQLVDVSKEYEIKFNQDILEKMRVLKPNIFLILPLSLNIKTLSYGIDVIYHYFKNDNLNPFQIYALYTLVFYQDDNKLSKNYNYVLKRCLDYLPNVKPRKITQNFLPWKIPNVFNDFDKGRTLFWLKWIANINGFWLNPSNIEHGLSHLGKTILNGNTKYLPIFTNGLSLYHYSYKKN